jgi:hypothetical protein
MKNNGKTILLFVITIVLVIGGYFVYAHHDATSATEEPTDALSQLEQNLQEEYKDGYPSLEKYYDCNSDFRENLNYLYNSEYSSYKIKDNTIFCKQDINPLDTTEEYILNNQEEIKEKGYEIFKEVADYANEKSNIETIIFIDEIYNGDKLLLSNEYTYTYDKRPEN